MHYEIFFVMIQNMGISEGETKSEHKLALKDATIAFKVYKRDVVRAEEFEELYLDAQTAYDLESGNILKATQFLQKHMNLPDYTAKGLLEKIETERPPQKLKIPPAIS